MDVLTHAVLGALSASALRAKSPRYRTAAIGAISALLPDLDVFIRSAEDPLLVLEYHRHFSHSLLFAPLGAVLATFLLWPLWRNHFTRLRAYSISLTGYISACLLDACTSYGTYLLWPLPFEAVALSIVAVIDPAFTLVLAIALIFSLARKPAAVYGMFAGILYLVAFGGLQHKRAHQTAKNWATERQMMDARIEVKPTLANLLLWRTLVVHQNQIYANAVFLPPFGEAMWYEGASRALFDPNTYPKESRAYKDLQRFYHLTNGMLIADPDNPQRIGDGRYAMLPHSLVPLWGIEINISKPDETPKFFTQRDNSPMVRNTFLQMLFGRPL